MANAMMEGKRPQDWINLILAGCLFLSPWIVGFAMETAPARNAWIVAAALAVITLAALSMFAEWEEWVNLLLGAWLIISPWALGFEANAAATWTHMAFGILTAIVSAWAVWDYRHTPHAA